MTSTTAATIATTSAKAPATTAGNSPTPTNTDIGAFKTETRAWLEENCPLSQRQPPVESEAIWGGRNRSFANADCQLWFERMRDKGWTVPDWPVEYGGAGLSPRQHKVLKEEMRRLKCRTPLNDLGIFMFGPALMEYGSAEQKAEHLPKIARGEIRWCQGYSEPGAGSDLANIQTKAEDKGDHFLVNGSKIWTSFADKSDWIFCLVRTDSSGKKQEGISFLLIDMDDPGISASPIELISGNRHFCQVWLDNVKVPKANLVHELHKGWTVGKAVLSHERKLMSESNDSHGSDDLTAIKVLDKYLARDAQGHIDNAELRTELTKHQMNLRAIELCQQRIFEEYMAGAPTALAMVMKYIGTEEIKRKDELMLAAMGNLGMAWPDETDNQKIGLEEAQIPRNWAMDKTYTIAGGSSEIQLNILAKNVLGLPD